MRKLYFKLLHLITLSLALGSCTKNNIKEPNINIDKPPAPIKVKTPKVSIPSWFSNQTDNTDSNLYGFGSGKTIRQAIENALGDMAQRLQVTVSTQTQFENNISGNKSYQKLSQQISTQTEKINIPNYNILNQSNSNGIYFIEIQINKAQTIQSLQDQITNNISQAENLYESSKNKSSLYRFNISQKIDNNIKIIISSLRTLTILDPQKNIDKEMQLLNKLHNQLLNIKRGLQIYVSKQNSGFFYDSLQEFLRKNNYTIVKQDQFANISIYLKLKNYDNFFKKESFCLNTTIELQATDNISSQLSPKQYIIKTCSKDGRLIAIDNANKIFYSELKHAESIY